MLAIWLFCITMTQAYFLQTHLLKKILLFFDSKIFILDLIGSFPWSVRNNVYSFLNIQKKICFLCTKEKLSRDGLMKAQAQGSVVALTGAFIGSVEADLKQVLSQFFPLGEGRSGKKKSKSKKEMKRTLTRFLWDHWQLSLPLKPEPHQSALVRALHSLQTASWNPTKSGSLFDLYRTEDFKARGIFISPTSTVVKMPLDHITFYRRSLIPVL